MMYEQQKPIAEKRDLLRQKERKNLSNENGEKTFNTTCPHCFEHHAIQVYYRKKEVSCLKCNKKFVATGGLKFRNRPIKKTLFEKIREVDPEIFYPVSVLCLLILSIPGIIIGFVVYERIVYTPEEREVRSQRSLLYGLNDELLSNIRSQNYWDSKIIDSYAKADSVSDLEHTLWLGEKSRNIGKVKGGLRSKIRLEEDKLRQLESALPIGHKLGEYQYSHRYSF